MDEQSEPPRTRQGESADAVRLRSLLEIAKVVGAVRRFDELVELTAEEARRALDAASLSISQVDRENGVLRTLVNVGWLGSGETRFPTDEVYLAALWQRAFGAVDDGHGYVSDVDDGTEEARLLAELGKDSSISVPIVVEARVWGEMFATRVDPRRRFAESELDFAVAVATQVAAGVVQADHFARVQRLAFEDPLTGLANRRAVDQRLDDNLAAYVADGTPVSLVLADINRLKQVNDSFGHAAGDRLIVAVGDAVSLASGLAPGSLAARIGGDEFCVVVSGAKVDAALAVAQELCKIVDGQPMSTGISCGVASTDSSPGRVDTPVRLFRLADAAQYRAKRSGSRQPVVAGGTADAPTDQTGDRRARRGRIGVHPQASLDAGLEVLDKLADAPLQARIEAVAEHVVSLVDAAAWWVSWVAPRSNALLVVGSSVARGGEATGPARDGGQFAAEAPYDLASYPVTAQAIERAGAFRVEIGDPDADPAEEGVLVASAYTAVLAAGATSAEGGWLVEIYADSISLPLDGFEPILRSLLAVAVSTIGSTVARLTALEGQDYSAAAE